MSRSHLVRCLVLGFALSLAAPSAWAGPRWTPEGTGSAWSLVKQLWQSFAAGWPDTGCWIDPGGCGTGQATAPPPDTEIGCWIDPYGGCGTGQAPAPPPETEVGCILDPHGGCGAGS